MTDLGPPGWPFRVGVGVAEQSSQRLGLGEREQAPGPRGRVEAVGEVRLGPGRLEDEWQPPIDRASPLAVRVGQTRGVHRALPLDAGERGALGLSLDDPDDELLDVQQVVDSPVTRSHHHLANGDARSCEEIQRLLFLNHPSGGLKLAVDEHPGALLRREALISAAVAHGPIRIIRRRATARQGSHENPTSAERGAQPG